MHGPGNVKLLFILDALESLKGYKDTSVAIMRAAQARGHEVHACAQSDLHWQGRVLARAGRLTLEALSTEAETLQRYFATRIGFPTRVFDLGMMGFELVGARVAAIGDRTAALWVYRGSGVWLLCQMYRGELGELPPPSETRESNGFVFRIYHERSGTQVFWQEGDVVCVLASDAPAETVIQLAFAKAMKP